MAKTTKKKKAVGIVSPKRLNVRVKPDGKIVDTIVKDSAADVLAEENGWFKIVCGNLSGWVKAEYLTIKEDEK